MAKKTHHLFEIELGDSRNIHSYTTDGILDFRRGGGGGGSLNWTRIPKEWGGGVITIGNPKAWRDFTGGISEVERVERVS